MSRDALTWATLSRAVSGDRYIYEHDIWWADHDLLICHVMRCIDATLADNMAKDHSGRFDIYSSVRVVYP